MTEERDDMLLVQLPEGGSPQMLWEVAAEQRGQIRHLRPQRSTLERAIVDHLRSGGHWHLGHGWFEL